MANVVFMVGQIFVKFWKHSQVGSVSRPKAFLVHKSDQTLNAIIVTYKTRHGEEITKNIPLCFSSIRSQMILLSKYSTCCHSIPSLRYSSCSDFNVNSMKSCCNFSLQKLMQSCSKLYIKSVSSYFCISDVKLSLTDLFRSNISKP